MLFAAPIRVFSVAFLYQVLAAQGLEEVGHPVVLRSSNDPDIVENAQWAVATLVAQTPAYETLSLGSILEAATQVGAA